MKHIIHVDHMRPTRLYSDSSELDRPIGATVGFSSTDFDQYSKMRSSTILAIIILTFTQFSIAYIA